MNNSLQPVRLLLGAALLALMISQTSCLSESAVEASFDGESLKEGGPSKVVYQNEFGANAGMSWMIGINDGGHHVSVNDVPASADNAGLAITPRVEFIQKGAKLDDSKIKLSYLNGIADVVYRWPMQDKGMFYAGLGPYIGYGISGKVKSDGFSEPAFGGNDGLRRFDAGLHLTARYRLPMGLDLGLAYEFGIYNQSPAPDYTSHTRTYSLQVGYSVQKIIDGFKKK